MSLPIVGPKGEHKRVRAPNYSVDEKIRLLNIIAKKKHVIENKTTDAMTDHDYSEAEQRRRPALSATVNVARGYEDLCAVKEIAETQLQIMKAFEAFQQNKIKEMDEASKVNKKTESELLLLEIEIKMAQLNKLKSS